VQRGHNRKAVFLIDQDYQYYLDNLREWKAVLGIKLYAWCLMTNHIHVIVEPGSDVMALSLMMKRISGRQAAYVNKLEGRSGSLWEGRYKASPIQRDSYLLSCCRYVELNPVRAGMVAKAEDYPWSSYQHRLSKEGETMLDKDLVYTGLANTEPERQQRYRAFVEEGLSMEEKRFIDDSVNRNQLTGGDWFIDEIEQRIGLRVERRGRGRPGNEGK
jgi:putative transposase